MELVEIAESEAVLRVKLLDPRAKPPTVAHAGSDLGFDLYALEDVVLEPGVMTRVRTGVAVEGPDGYGFVLGDRSSMAARGVTYAGGRIDAGYRGEILVCLVNVNQPVYTLREERDAAGEGASGGEKFRARGIRAPAPIRYDLTCRSPQCFTCTPGVFPTQPQPSAPSKCIPGVTFPTGCSS